MASMNVVLVAMVMSVYLCKSLGYPTDNEKKEMSNKEIKENFDVLTNEIKYLKTEVKLLMSKVGPSETQVLKNISVLAVSRKFLPDGQVRFTVRYRAVGDLHTKHKWILVKRDEQFAQRETISNKIQTLPRHVYESNLVVPPGNDSFAAFLLANKNEWIHLRLQNAWEGDVTLTNIELPIWEVSPSRELVYEPGQNISVKMTVPKKLQKRGPGDLRRDDNYRLEYNFLLPGSAEVISIFNHKDDFFTKEKVEKFLDRQRFEAELNTDEYPLMGLFELTTGTVDPSGFVAIEYGQQLVLRPSTQQGAFPYGQLYMPDYNWLDKNDNGEYEKFCGYGELCGIHCNVVGDQVTTLKLYETLNGQTKLLPMVTLGAEDPGSYRISGMYTMRSNPGSPSAVTYTCVGSNAVGRRVSRKVVVYTGQRATIARNETGLKLLENGNAVVNCTASGLPRPQITINCGQVTVTEPEVIYKTEDVIRVTATCEGRDHSWISCGAKNRFSSDFELVGTYGWPGVYVP